MRILPATVVLLVVLTALPSAQAALNQAKPYHASYPYLHGLEGSELILASGRLQAVALPRLDRSAQCAVAAGLLKQRDRLEHDDWRNWNFARARARRLLRDQWTRLHADACPKARRRSG